MPQFLLSRIPGALLHGAGTVCGRRCQPPANFSPDARPAILVARRVVDGMKMLYGDMNRVLYVILLITNQAAGISAVSFPLPPATMPWCKIRAAGVTHWGAFCDTTTVIGKVSSQLPPYIAPHRRCASQRPGVQPRPQPKPAPTDFDLQPYSHEAIV